MKKFEDFFLKRDKKQTNTLNKQKKTQTKTKVIWFFFYQGKVEGLCKSSGCQVLPQQLCQFIKWELWTNT